MADTMTFPKTVEEFMEKYKVVDTEQIYSNGMEFVPIFRMKQWFEHLECRPMTNGDKFRSMADEELAIELAHITECPRCPAKREHCGMDCHKAWREWLKEEVQDDQR